MAAIVPHTHDTDLIIIGGGPAGCAAARTAASVGMRSLLIEPDALCRTLHRIPALNNVLGGHTTGPELADAITTEVQKTPLCHVEFGRRATEVRAFNDHVTVVLDTSIEVRASFAIVATGVGPLEPGDVSWITAPGDITLPQLWKAKSAAAEGRTLLVLGGDRPIGTFLRAHPNTEARLLVTYPEGDDYKIEEVRDDSRVTLVPVEHVTLHGQMGATKAETLSRDGERQEVAADAVLLNIGTKPTAPSGDLVLNSDGYCPPAEQHPRVIVAGDLRSARFQRIMTALGSGSEAALHAYYTTRELPAQGPSGWSR